MLLILSPCRSLLAHHWIISRLSPASAPAPALPRLLASSPDLGSSQDHLASALALLALSPRRSLSPRCPLGYLKVILVPALALLALLSSLRVSLTAGLSPDYARPPPHAPASLPPHVARRGGALSQDLLSGNMYALEPEHRETLQASICRVSRSSACEGTVVATHIATNNERRRYPAS